MGKCFDDFEDMIGRVNHDFSEGKLNKDGINAVYLGMLTGYLATIADELHDMNEINKEMIAKTGVKDESKT